MGIVAGTWNLNAARKFIAFTSSTHSMAALRNIMAYSRARFSSLPLVGSHVDTGIDMNPHMPNHPANMTRVLRNDYLWWSDHSDQIVERFSAWLAR